MWDKHTKYWAYLCIKGKHQSCIYECLYRISDVSGCEILTFYKKRRQYFEFQW